VRGYDHDGISIMRVDEHYARSVQVPRVCTGVVSMCGVGGKIDRGLRQPIVQATTYCRKALAGSLIFDAWQLESYVKVKQ